MSDLWKQWIGQTVDAQFPLLQHLGHTEHSAVFLTEYRSSQTQSQKAAIKFISAETPTAARQLTLWSQISQFHHPGLSPIYHAGRCRLTGMDLLYVVTELADEHLAQILPQRPLTPEETRQMLDPVVDALAYLHHKGMAHGHIKPSNILAARDFLKLSSDTVVPVGESPDPQRERDVYDAPERATTPVAAAADIWSLGQTLVETLTQQTAVLPDNEQVDPFVPESIPEPFREIARRSLHRNPARRCCPADVATLLNPAVVSAPQPHPEPIAIAVAASVAASALSPSRATTSVPPLNVPLSREPAVPLAKLPATEYARSKAVPSPVRHKRELRSAPPDFVLPNFVVPLILTAALVLIAFFALPKLFRNQPKAGTSDPTPSATTSNSADSSASPARSETATSQSSVPLAKPQASNVPKISDGSNNPVFPPAAPAPQSSAHKNSQLTDVTKSATASAGKAEVLSQVLPAVSEKALATIHGTVRVTVRAQVDPVGRVSNAELLAPGPSNYFAERALAATRQWEFSSPESNGHSLPSEWLIRFEFSPSGPRAYPTQTSP